MPERLARKAELVAIGQELRAGDVATDRRDVLRVQAALALDYLSPCRGDETPTDSPDPSG
jgi:hypothetical protein